MTIYDNHYLNAEMSIPNARNFRVDIELSGAPGIDYVGMLPFLRLKIFRPRCLALICAIDKMAPLSPYREWNFGKRTDGDIILFSQRNDFSSANDQLPRHKIEFEDKNATLTSVSIRLNVSN